MNPLLGKDGSKLVLIQILERYNLSYDFDTTRQVCDHIVLREPLYLGSDGFSLFSKLAPSLPLRGSINGEDSVELFLNGVSIPKSHSQFAWKIISPIIEDDLQDQRKQIVFLQQQRIFGFIFEVNYRTIPAHCRKCNGSGKINDFKIGNSRRLLPIFGYPKLLQRILKYILTSSCKFYPRLTSNVSSSIGRKLGISLTEDDISSAITSSLANLQQIQQAQKTIQEVTPDEMLQEVEQVLVERDSEDPTRVRTSILASSYGSSSITPLSFSIRTNR